MTSLSSAAVRRANAAAIFAVAVTVLSWGSAFPMIRVGMRDFGALELAAARFAVASALALAWLAFRRPPPPTRADAGRFLVCGLIGISVLQRPAQSGRAHRKRRRGGVHRQRRADPDRHSRHRLSARAVFGLGLGRRAGQLRRRRPRSPSASRGGLAFGGGASLVAGAALCTASYFVLQRPLVPRYGALACTAYTLLAGALFLPPFLPGALPHARRARRPRARRRRWSRSASFPRRSATPPGPMRSAASARRAPPISSTSCRRSRRWSDTSALGESLSALTLAGGADRHSRRRDREFARAPDRQPAPCRQSRAEPIEDARATRVRRPNPRPSCRP